MMRVLVFLLLSFQLLQIRGFVPLGGWEIQKTISQSCKSLPYSLRRETLLTVRSSLLPVETVHSMPDPLPCDLKNNYYLLRHGQSTANVAEVISSNRGLAYTDKHGLTRTGYDQGKASAKLLLEILKDQIESGDVDEAGEVIMVSSPFARARGTAQACLDGLAEMKEEIADMGLTVDADIVLEDNLVERYFGRLDDKAIYTYAYVWPLDRFNVTHTAFDVESVAAVCTRIRDMVVRLEERYATGGKYIVLVSHADVLQIAQLYAAGAENVGEFSSYRFTNGEVRSMLIDSTECLPEPSPLEPPLRTTRTS